MGFLPRQPTDPAYRDMLKAVGDVAIIENYVWRRLETDPLDELARARDFIRANLGRRD